MNNSFDPLKFLDLKKSEILFIFTMELHYSQEKALLKFAFMTDTVKRLNPLRAFKLQTINFLGETISQLSPKSKSFIVNFLLKSLEFDDSYGEAFNYLASVANLYQLIPIELKQNRAYEILYLLESEKNKELHVPRKIEEESCNSVVTFQTFLTLDELNTVRLRLIKLKIINKISKSDFKYLFSANPVSPSMSKILWNDSRGLCHEFLSRIVYNQSKFISRQANNCISFKDGKKIDSNDKSRAQYKNNDILDQILRFDTNTNADNKNLLKIKHG